MALMVGVSGIRGTVGETLTPAVALEFAHAYGTVLERGRVLLARDTRPSGAMFAAAAEAGLLAAGCEVTRADVAMTPTVGYAIRSDRYAGGVVITASHNPSQWNGLKFLDDRGVAPNPQRAARIAEIRASRTARCERSDFQPVRTDTTIGARHVAAVRDAVEADLSSIRGLRVVLDSVNGAGCLVTPGFLESLGCDVVHLNGEPHGRFAHTPEPVAENLGDLCAAVRQRQAAVGFAQDPDADRLAIVDENGTYIGEEYTLALSVWSVLSRRRGPVAANLSTSRMIDAIAERFDCRVVRTAVGEANVVEGMIANDCVIGGEGNGGVIDPRICWVRDSLSAMSLVLQLMAATGKRLSQLVAEIPRYAIIKQKIECDSRERIAKICAAAAEAFRDERLSTIDGTRIDFDQGWVHLRGSNTEPIIRVMAEADSADVAEQLIRRVRSAVGL
ncbi:MAG: phosphoglucosamine mutase [Planctomycetota bacterium]|nr:MAG: phosphoglucosamine mutase [Planctomycetota bacterium]